MANVIRTFLVLVLLVLFNQVRAEQHQQKPLAEGPVFSDLWQGKVTDGQLNRAEKLNIARLRKYDPTRARQLESQLKQKKTSLEKVSDAYKNLGRAHERFDEVEKLYLDGFAKIEKVEVAALELEVAFNIPYIARARYKADLEKNYPLAEKTRKQAWEKLGFKVNVWARKYRTANTKKRK